jgi:tetratricopeptide (TPR) repeat protein
VKIKIGIALLLCCTAMNSVAQQHFQYMGLAVDNFLQNCNDKFEAIPVIWNMEGIIQADLNDGINYLLENEPARAEESLDIILKNNKTVWQAYYYRAMARKQQENYHQALDDLQAALKLKPKLYEAHVEIAKCQLAINSLAESERAVKSAIELDRNRAAAYYVKGCLYESRNQYNSAIRSFRDCLKADSLYNDAHIKIAMILLFENKDETSAINELTSVLYLDSLQQDALMMRSLLVFDKQEQQSLRDLTKLIQVNPNNIVAFYLRGILLTNTHRYDRAFSDFQTVIKATSTSDNNFQGEQTWVDKKIDIQNVGAYTLTRVYGLSDEDATKLKEAYCLIVTNACDKSIAVLNSTSNPTGEPLVVYLKAVANEHCGKHAQAFILYSEAINLDNTIADAYKKRGIYEQELKQWEKSIRDLTTVLRLMPESDVIYKIRGISYYYNKQFDNAIADYTAYLKHDSTNEQIIGYRGLAYRDNNQRLNAYIDFANSHNAEAFVVEDVLHVIDSVLQKGDTTLALNALTTFVKGYPSFTEAYALKLKLHVKQNDWTHIESSLFNALRNSRPDAPKEDRAYLMTLKGMFMSKGNRPDDALDAFDEAIRFDKNNSFAYLQRGKFLLTRNKTSKATDDLKKAVSLGDPEAKKLLDGLKN